MRSRRRAQPILNEADTESLLAGLRGRDVVIAFVESYGRDSIEYPGYAATMGATLDNASRRRRPGSTLAVGTSPHRSPARQLARAHHVPVGLVDGQRTAVRDADLERTRHGGRCLPSGRLANGRGHAGQHRGLAGGSSARSWTIAASVIAGPTWAGRVRPISTVSRPSSGPSTGCQSADRCSPRSRWCPATLRGRSSP